MKKTMLFEFNNPAVGVYENSLRLKNEILKNATALSSVFIKLDMFQRAQCEHDFEVVENFIEEALILVDQLIADSKKVLLGGI